MFLKWPFKERHVLWRWYGLSTHGSLNVFSMILVSCSRKVSRRSSWPWNRQFYLWKHCISAIESEGIVPTSSRPGFLWSDRTNQPKEMAATPQKVSQRQTATECCPYRVHPKHMPNKFVDVFRKKDSQTSCYSEEHSCGGGISWWPVPPQYDSSDGHRSGFLDRLWPCTDILRRLYYGKTAAMDSRRGWNDGRICWLSGKFPEYYNAGLTNVSLESRLSRWKIDRTWPYYYTYIWWFFNSGDGFNNSVRWLDSAYSRYVLDIKQSHWAFILFASLHLMS